MNCSPVKLTLNGCGGGVGGTGGSVPEGVVADTVGAGLLRPGLQSFRQRHTSIVHPVTTTNKSMLSKTQPGTTTSGNIVVDCEPNEFGLNFIVQFVTSQCALNRKKNVAM